MRRAAYPSGCARCGAGAGCSAVIYQSLHLQAHALTLKPKHETQSLIYTLPLDPKIRNTRAISLGCQGGFTRKAFFFCPVPAADVSAHKK